MARGSSRQQTAWCAAEPSRLASRIGQVLGPAWLVAAVLIGCGGEHPDGTGDYGQGVYIPAHWQQTRTIEGHRVHVVEQKVACSSCHQLTDREIGPVTPSACKTCHEKESAISHAAERAHEQFGPEIDSDCRSCHVFTLQATEAGPHAALAGPYEAKDCLRCHSSAQGNLAPVVVHRPAGCLNCHQPHEQDKPVSAACSDCHDDTTTTHASEGKSLLETCTTCHQSQHAPASAAIETCGACHEGSEPVIAQTALFDEGHGQCIGCHRPHDFEKEAAVPCQSCHEEKPILASASVPAHRSCTSCHNPHDVKGASAVACSTCHQSVSPNHPKHGEAGTCTGCHDPHPTTRNPAKARECSSCHHEAAHEDSFHEGVACKSCHAPHQFLLATAGVTLCGQCHSQNVQLVSAHAGHQECTSCHTGLPHRPGRLNAACTSCHQDVHAAANAGHTDCQSCHDPHGTQMVRECGDCHEQEHRTAPQGHQSCTSCHDQHSGSHTKSTCASCHGEEARTPHGNLAGDCSACHSPHGPKGIQKPPSCSTCHDKSTLPGLHHEKQHSQCSTCHTAHAEPVQPERATCLSCHQDKKEHYPKAGQCSSCHLFGPTK